MVVGVGYWYLGGGYGMYWFSVRFLNDFWGVENVFGVFFVDYVRIFFDVW